MNKNSSHKHNLEVVKLKDYVTLFGIKILTQHYDIVICFECGEILVM